jgi:hypothetical protein
MLNMEDKLTELEKTILLAMLSLTKGKDQFVRRDDIVMKFSRFQKKMVIKYLDRLVSYGYLEKHPKALSYKFKEAGKKRAVKLLMEGAQLW